MKHCPLKSRLTDNFQVPGKTVDSMTSCRVVAGGCWLLPSCKEYNTAAQKHSCNCFDHYQTAAAGKMLTCLQMLAIHSLS